MSLEKVSTLLKHASDNKYGIAAINFYNFESTAWAVEAAEIEKMPIILQFYPGFSEHIPMHIALMLARYYAANASVPVAVHLDHSPTFDIAMQGLSIGYPSVMIDGSALPFEDNILLTAAVTKCAKAIGADVEAELGHVGSGMSLDDLTDKDRFTDPDQAEEFIARTGAGSLAIAVGNAHGDYVKTPQLDFARIQILHKRLSVPLVMHGGSDIPDEQLGEAVQCGMSKFNIATEYQKAFYSSMKDFICKDIERQYMYHALLAIKEPCINFVRNKIRVLNPNSFYM